MTALIPVNDLWDRALSACLAGLAPNTQRAYRQHCARFQASGYSLTREGVKLWLQAEDARGLSGQGVNQAAAAIKKLAWEASESNWIDIETWRSIDSIKGKPVRGTRTGNWLTLEQVRALLALPDRSTIAGQRDACVLALLLGCGLRREEACGLDVSQLVDGPGGLVLANLEGKAGRVRTVGVPAWAARDIEAWLKVAEITEGKILRSMK